MVTEGIVNDLDVGRVSARQHAHALGVYFAIIKATITPFQETLRLRCAKELYFPNSPHMLCVRVERLYFEL